MPTLRSVVRSHKALQILWCGTELAVGWREVSANVEQRCLVC